MLVFFLTTLLVGAFFFLLSLKILLKKGGQFSGTCASQSPFLNKAGVRCSLCKKEAEPGGACRRRHERSLL